VVLTLMCVPIAGAQPSSAGSRAVEEQAVRAVLARFYEGWNAHDADKMVSVFADDVDHINVFAEWRRGKELLRDEIREFHAGPGRNSQKTYTVEKIRFVKPDVAVVQVRSLSTVGNIGTYVLTKDTGRWLVVSFTNVGYELTPTGPNTGITRPPSPNAGAAVPTERATGASTTVPVPGGCAVRRTGPSDAVGCYLAGTEAFGAAPAAPLFWHLDRYPTRAAAEAARRAHGTVVEAHGRVWLFTLADSTWRPTAGAAGERVARVGPLPVTPGRMYAAHYLEGVVPVGARTPVHRHAGPEAWYVLAGAQCLETPDGARVVRAGESFVVPEGPPMALVGTGTVTRRTLGLVLHDAAQPWSIPTSDWAPKGICTR
jgi:uncharacterized protein (TIGR02246 family)